MAVDPLSLEREIIERETETAPFDVLAPLSAGLKAGQAVSGVVKQNEEDAKAMEFEKLLQSGEEGMRIALQDAKAQGADLTGVPDPKLYLKTKEDAANWYAILADKLERHEKRAASSEAFQKISTGTPGEAQEGIGRLVESEQIGALEGAQAARKITFDQNLQKHISGEIKLVPTDSDVEGVQIEVDKFAPSEGTLEAPDDIKTAAESAAKKVGIPTDVLLSIAKRESNFIPDAKNPLSTATGLGQLIEGTGKEMFAKAQAEGLIGKDVKFEDAVVDSEMNLIMTGLYFKQNLETMGNVRDALLAHRLGPAGARKFNETGKAIVEGRDETADVNDWIAKVLRGALADGATGIFADGGANLDTVAGIDAEIQRLLGDTRFSATPQVKIAVAELQKKRALLSKGGKKKGATGKEENAANTIDLVVALADNVEPAGFAKGTFKNILAFFNIDAPTATLNQFSGLLAGQIAKGVGGESGRLTDQDRAFALAAMPNARDSEQVRANKIAILQVIVDKLRGANEGDVASQDALRKAVFVTAGQNGQPMEEEQLRKGYKRNPTDGIIKAFLWSNGREATPENIATIKQRLGGAPAPAAAPATTPGATTIQSGAESTSQFGGVLNIPGIGQP